MAIDALGFANKLRAASDGALIDLWRRIDDQYLEFRAKIPNLLVIRAGQFVLGTREFETFRLNDMFLLYSRREMPDPALRYLLAASLLYQQMLRVNFLPRGGLGFGQIIRGDGLLIGPGFMDAYDCAEKRTAATKDICAIQISPSFLNTVGRSEKTMRLVCFYRGQFFVHPHYIVDPDMGAFNAARILDNLKEAGADDAKITATAQFLDDLEDYDAASLPGSKSAAFRASPPLC